MAASGDWWAYTGSGAGDVKQSVNSPGKDWIKIPGATPSMTRAQAIQKVVDDVANGTFGSKTSNGLRKLVDAAAKAAGIPNFAAFADIGHALSAFYAALTNWRMWASLGWIILGLVLFILGAVLLVKGEITKSIIPGVALWLTS